MRDVAIEPKEEGKGRVFRAVCLASVEADPLWEGGATAGDKRRPVWAVFGGSEGDLRPFMANLRLGKPIRFPDDKSGYSRRHKGEKMEFLRSAGYELISQRTPDGTMVTVTLPDLVRVDPGMVDPEAVRFVMLTSQEYLAAQPVSVGDAARAVHHARRAVPELPKVLDEHIVPAAMLFTAYLDRRTRCPIVADARFHLQLFAACLRGGLASLPEPRHGEEFGCSKTLAAEVHGLDDLRIARPVTFQASHDAIEALLATEVDRFFKLTKGKS